MEVWPQFTNEMIDVTTNILKSGKVNQWTNPIVREFEEKFAKYIDCKYAAAVFNGTVALELCIKALELKKGDEVIVTPRTFIASASCIVWNKLTPIFVDVDKNSQNITLNTIKAAITEKTRAIILVHLAGWPCDLKEICEYCRENNIYVIEDCAQAHGAKYNDKHVGTWGDINAWSFCQDKIITTGGEGGMITTNNIKLYKKAWSIKDHGKGYDTVFYKTHADGFRWLHDTIGTNWRMLPMQAAIGIIGLNHLDEWVQHRRNIANIYSENLKNIDGVILTIPDDNIYHAYYKYYFFIDPEKFKISRDKIIELINKENIFAQVGSCGEIYNEVALSEFKPENECKTAKYLFDTAIMLKCDPCISELNAIQSIEKIKNILLNNQKIKNVYIVGCGGNGKIVIDICEKNGHNIMGIYDDNLNCKVYKNYKLIGPIDQLTDMKNINIINSIGSIEVRKNIFNKFPNLNWINCIDPSANIQDTVIMGKGNIICTGAIINADAHIGDYNLINTCAIIEHDCVVGDNNHIAPTSVLCGGVTIGNNNLLGVKVAIIPGINVGDGNIIGAGSVVIRNITNENTVVGVPAKNMM
jgi:sugar O-acyltransferase (sialic acid O-acetyltransferase NeuD family)